MFRVLSEEETKNVKRWQAPELDAGTTRVADTRQQGKPQDTHSGYDVRPILGSREQQPGAYLQRASVASAAPDLQSIDLIDVFTAKDVVTPDAPGANSETAGAENFSAATAQMLQSSYDQGYEKGLAEGIAALHQQSVKELRNLITAISEASEQQADPLVEREMLALTIEIARLVIRREVTLQPDILLDIINAGIEQLGGEHSKTRKVILNPIDASEVRQHVPEGSDIALIDNPEMPRGGCRIETATSAVDAGIEDWLQTVSAQLLD